MFLGRIFSSFSILGSETQQQVSYVYEVAGMVTDSGPR